MDPLIDECYKISKADLVNQTLERLVSLLPKVQALKFANYWTICLLGKFTEILISSRYSGKFRRADSSAILIGSFLLDFQARNKPWLTQPPYGFNKPDFAFKRLVTSSACHKQTKSSNSVCFGKLRHKIHHKTSSAIIHAVFSENFKLAGWCFGCYLGYKIAPRNYLIA